MYMFARHGGGGHPVGFCPLCTVVCTKRALRTSQRPPDSTSQAHQPSQGGIPTESPWPGHGPRTSCHRLPSLRPGLEPLPLLLALQPSPRAGGLHLAWYPVEHVTSTLWELAKLGSNSRLTSRMNSFTCNYIFLSVQALKLSQTGFRSPLIGP